MILCKIVRKIIIYDCHGFNYKELLYKKQYKKSAVIKYFERILLRNTDYIITITDDLAKSIRKYISEDKIFVVRNGIDLNAFKNVPEHVNILEKYSISTDVPLIGFIGNWERWINIEELLEANNYLCSARVIIVGDGPKVDYYKKAYPEVIFTGRVPYDDAVNLLKKFSICILPYSRDPIMREKSARKTYEYMAAGKPIIVNAVVGKEDFLIENKNCLIYEPENPKDLADKIMFLLSNKHLLKRIGHNNDKLAKVFTWDNLIHRSRLLRILKA